MTATPSIILLRSDSGMRDSRLQKEVRMFVEAGFDTTLFCWDRAREFPNRESKDGCTIYRCHVPAPYASKWLFVMTPIWLLYELAFLIRHRSDFIHACDFDTILPALAVRFFRGTPVVYDIYDFYAAKSHTIPMCLRGFFRRAEAVCARLADAVIIVDAARLYLLGDAAPKRLAIAMNCPYDAVQPTWRKPERDEFVIFYGGAIAQHRGIEKLISATANIDGVRVLMAGWITHESYRELIHQSPRVEYRGIIPYDDALRLTYEADAVYSYYDPDLEINRTANSSKMFDAFMCATAVLANAEPPSARSVREYEAGSLLAYDDDEGLRRTICAWRDNRSLAHALGRNGRRAFEEEFNWLKMSCIVLDVYRELGWGGRA